ncbi:MAG: plasmid pRiA4b ORF-3 family protein [Prolixibacteraceae bacterium]|nr:plasmid pRiA4b ORF-3 family protein [Prolixibacteraceae bacterium]
MIFQFKIKIKGITKPPVWRRIAVPANFTFSKFHKVIQLTFGWENYHLYDFAEKEYDKTMRIAEISEDDFDDFLPTHDASKFKLSDYFSENTRKLKYIYDYGDSWIHEITLESISNNKTDKAVCLAGKGTCPPEDCGGVGGYEELKYTFLEAPKSEDADEYREWLGLEKNKNWDTDNFNIKSVNSYLKVI